MNANGMCCIAQFFGTNRPRSACPALRKQSGFQALEMAKKPMQNPCTVAIPAPFPLHGIFHAAFAVLSPILKENPREAEIVSAPADAAGGHAQAQAAGPSPGCRGQKGARPRSATSSERSMTGPARTRS